MDSQTLPAATELHPPPAGLHCGDPTQQSNCEYCEGNFYSTAVQESGKRRYHGSVTAEEAQNEINRTIKETSENLFYVKSKLDTHGDLIVSWWSKRSIDKRGALLSTAAASCFGQWPPVSETNPVPNSLFSGWHPTASREKVFPYALWLRGKDFAEDRMKLLQLLFLRTEHTLQDWAMHDTIESRTVFRQAIALPYTSHCVQMHGDDYGQLVKLNDMLVHTCAIMSFPRALSTIRAQHAISIALGRVVQVILADASPSGNSNWKKLVLNLNKRGEGVRWSFYEHPALVPPCAFDPQTLLEKAINKFNELADDIELLSTDPEYMLECVLTLEASMRFRDPVPTTMKWNLIGVGLMSRRIYMLVQWARVVEACRIVQRIFTTHRHSIRPGATLPSEVGEAMWVFISILDETARLQSEVFSQTLHHMAALKDCFAVVRAGGKYVWRHLRLLDPKRKSDRLLASAVAVQNAMEANSMCGARREIQLLLGKLSSSRHEKSIYEEISTIALIDEMRLARIWSQLGPFKAPPQGLDMFMRPQGGSKLQDSQDSQAHMHTSGSSNQNTSSRASPDFMDSPIVQRLGPLLQKFCETPWPKDHRSPTWLEKVTESRRCLAAFWHVAREEWKRFYEVQGRLHPKIEQLINSMAFDTAPEYLEEVRKEREQAVQARKLSAPQALQTTWGVTESSTPGIGSIPSRSTKTKTTGSSAADHHSVVDLSLKDDKVTQTNSGSVAIPTIPVKQDSLSVFRKMFSSNTGTLPGSVKWTQLVQALNDAGLIATQAPGSAVTFASTDAGAINLHKPHEPTVDALMLRRMGKRLRKWFGWTGERFVLRAKERESSTV